MYKSVKKVLYNFSKLNDNMRNNVNQENEKSTYKL